MGLYLVLRKVMLCFQKACAGGLFFYFEQVAGLREFDECISVVWQQEQTDTPVDVLEVKGCATT